MSSKKANPVKKPISKNITPHTTSLIKQIKSSALAQKNKMKFISNPVSSNKSKSRSKSNHKKIKTQINLQSVLSKFNSFSSRDSKRKSINSLSSLHDIIIDTKKNLVNASTMNATNIINNNTIIAKLVPTQETINTTGNNNYTAANTTISSVKKSPKVIQDFSFYKKKNSYNTHFISKTHHTSLMNNSNAVNYKVPLNKKCPIVSIKLKKLSGDNDSITGEF